ncbi:MAG: carboxymuconolactone decarboxylase family protein [Alphaproteobacteria bacterium]|nr:carboxymuconolactone decarboxylase family protein [Alphaproteobacteria bacterium]
MSRLPELEYDRLDSAQKAMWDRLVSGPRGRVAGPYHAWLRIPQFAAIAEQYGRYVRYETSLPARLTEMAILIVARHWNAQVEWWAHHPLALKAGLDPAIADAIAHRKEPHFVNEDEALVYALTRELIDTKKVSDPTYARAKDLFGETGLIDLIAVLGNYFAVALVLNTFEIMPPDGSTPLPP